MRTGCEPAPAEGAPDAATRGKGAGTQRPAPFASRAPGGDREAGCSAL